jgi:DDE superfamily endonuclease
LSRGYALIDREICLPRCWADDPQRCAAAGVSENITFAMKITLARRMLAGPWNAGTQAAWAIADEFDEGDRNPRRDLQGRIGGYVVAVAKNHRSRHPRRRHATVTVRGGRWNTERRIVRTGFRSGPWRPPSGGALMFVRGRTDTQAVPHRGVDGRGVNTLVHRVAGADRSGLAIRNRACPVCPSTEPAVSPATHRFATYVSEYVHVGVGRAGMRPVARDGRIIVTDAVLHVFDCHGRLIVAAPIDVIQLAEGKGLMAGITWVTIDGQRYSLTAGTGRPRLFTGILRLFKGATGRNRLSEVIAAKQARARAA